MSFVVKKRVSLEFLGEEYKDSYLILKSISVSEYEKLGDKTVRQAVTERVLGGEIQQDEGMIKITKDNIKDLPGEVFVQAFAAITGQLDPKLEGQLTTQSSTPPQAPQN